MRGTRACRSLPKLIESKNPQKRYYVMPDEDSEDSDATTDDEATEGKSAEDNDIQFVKFKRKRK